MLVGSARNGLPCPVRSGPFEGPLLRADVDQPSEAVLEEQLVRQAVKYLTEDEALTADRGFKPVTFIKAGCKRMAPRRATFILRRPKNFTARRRTAPTYAGRGRKPTRPEIVRP